MFSGIWRENSKDEVRIRLTSSAELDLLRALEYYDSVEPGLGAKLLREIKETQKRIQLNPLAWPRLSPRTRRCRAHRFPYALFYQVRPDEILVLAVMDLRKDPVHWRHYI